MSEEKKFVVSLDKDCDCIRVITLGGSKFSIEEVRELIHAAQDALFDYDAWEREIKK